MKTIKVTDSTVINSIVESANIKSSGININQTGVIATGGLKFATINRLGVAPDNKEAVLLVTEVKEEVENFKGMHGKLWELRGSIGALLIATKYSVTCAKAYDRIICKAENESKVGTCAYKGTTYLAIKLRRDSARDLFFSGFYSGNCVFTIVLDSDVVWS